jgi:hypothetical protein
MCKLKTLKAVMSLKNKIVPFRFLSEPMGGADIAHFAISAASENRRHAERQHACATRLGPAIHYERKVPKSR